MCRSTIETCYTYKMMSTRIEIWKVVCTVAYFFMAHKVWTKCFYFCLIDGVSVRAKRSVGLWSSSSSHFFKLSALALALSENRECAPVSLKLCAPPGSGLCHIFLACLSNLSFWVSSEGPQIAGNPAVISSALSASSLLLILEWPLIHANYRWLPLPFTFIHTFCRILRLWISGSLWLTRFFLNPVLSQTLLWPYQGHLLRPLICHKIGFPFSLLRRFHFSEWKKFEKALILNCGTTKAASHLPSRLLAASGKRRVWLITLPCGVPFLKDRISNLVFPIFTSNDLSVRKCGSTLEISLWCLADVILK